MIETWAVQYTTRSAKTCKHPRLWWLAWWCGWVFGPIIMATVNPQTLAFGVTVDGRFKFVTWTWR